MEHISSSPDANPPYVSSRSPDVRYETNDISSRNASSRLPNMISTSPNVNSSNNTNPSSNNHPLSNYNPSDSHFNSSRTDALDPSSRPVYADQIPIRVGKKSKVAFTNHINSPMPIEIIPVSIVTPSYARHRSPVKKLKARVPKTLPLSAQNVRVTMSPEPIAYIPVTLDHPPLNPNYLPKAQKSNKPKALKKLSPPKSLGMEYISIPITSMGDSPGYSTPQNSKSLGYLHMDARNAVPTAPRLSNVSLESSMVPSPFASINPRKLRSQRVSPHMFARPQLRYQLL